MNYSRIINSVLKECTATNNSKIYNSSCFYSWINNSVIDPSNTSDSNITNSTITDSTVWYSVVLNSNLTGSNTTWINITYSFLTNVSIDYSNISNLNGSNLNISRNNLQNGTLKYKFAPHYNFTAPLNLSRIYNWMDPNITFNETLPYKVTFGNNFTISAIIQRHDVEGSYIKTVNFTLYHPNGSIIMNNANGTQTNATDSNLTMGWQANTTFIATNGTYYVMINVTDSEDDKHNSEWSFIVTDQVNYTPQAYYSTPDPKIAKQNMTIRIWQDSSETMTFAINVSLNTTNSSNFVIEAPTSILVGNTSINNTYNLSVNITADAEVPTGIYRGNITLNRTLDGTLFQFFIELGLDPPTGDPDILNGSFIRC